MAGWNSQIRLSARQSIPLHCSDKTCKTFRQLSSCNIWQDIQQADLCGPRSRGLFSQLSSWFHCDFFVSLTQDKLNASLQSCTGYQLTSLTEKKRCHLDHYCNIVLKVSIALNLPTLYYQLSHY